ncbi:MAG: hypothetical protein JWO09_845 [Bacteroidetes bacterium]|nr:hypothetical protein [Bacteroidota bacterium]
MKKLLLTLLLIQAVIVSAQTDSAALKDIQAFRNELDREYKTPGESPLAEKEIAAFKGHDFFAVDLKFRVEAKLIVTGNEKEFKMKTSTEAKRDYVKYGELHFSIDGRDYTLNVYQSLDLRKQEKYKDYLFVPFTDLTTGHTSYGGGRYIDLRIPEGNTITLDFNKAYNPYCAYATGYSCPIPPRENFLDLKVEAGIRYTGDH